jgi:glycosyl transferase family 11
MRQKYTTTMVRVAKPFMDLVLWPEYNKHAIMLDELNEEILTELISKIHLVKEEEMIIAFARSVILEELKNSVFIENEPHYIDLFLFTFCKHNIITNSTFGWWGAGLTQNHNKMIIAPRIWFHPSYPFAHL